MSDPLPAAPVAPANPATPAVTITLRPNGPLLVAGPVRLIDHEGKEFNIAGKAQFALCRCGQTKNRPFCDGTHKECGWAAMDSAR